MKTLKLLAAVVLAVALLMFPALAEGQGRSGGHGRGSQGNGRSNGGYYGGGGQRSGGGFHNGSNYRAPVYRDSPSYRQGIPHGYYGAPGYRAQVPQGYHHYPYSRHYGGPVYRGWYWGIPFFAGVGFLSGYWWNGYYYTYPYQDICRRFIPTGGYHKEIQQDPNTGQSYEVEIPDGYWETIPCR